MSGCGGSWAAWRRATIRSSTSGAATGVLLAVSMELSIRMRRFQEYPFALCLLSNKYFPAENIKHISAFPNTSYDRLDVGCGLQVHQRAWECGTESAAILWLLSDPVQAMLDRLVEILLTNSLEAERRHAQIKKWEGSKLTHIATASRNAIVKRYLVWREGVVRSPRSSTAGDQQANTHQRASTRVAAAARHSACW